jgi:hypothetical protein
VEEEGGDGEGVWDGIMWVAVEGMFSEVASKFDEVSGGGRGDACGVTVRGASRASRGSVAMIDEECQRQLIY